MRIAEISTQDLRRAEAGAPTVVYGRCIIQIESLIKQFEEDRSESDLNLNQLFSDLRQSLGQLSQLAPFPGTVINQLKLHIWKLSCRLWNAGVDLSNASSIRSSSAAIEDHANLRQIASDMLSLAVDASSVSCPEIKAAFFYYNIGVIWHSGKKFDFASNCFEKATDLLSKVDWKNVMDTGKRTLLLDLNIACSRTAWEIKDPILAVTFLNRAKNLLFGKSDHYKALANQYLIFGKSMLSIDSENKDQCFREALKLMNDALDLCENGFSTARTRTETLDLKELKFKSLRFIAAVHLQMEEYENVIKCVKILREGEGSDNHPSLPVLAMKAWLGLGRYGNAEKELHGMVVNKGIPESVWVSAVEDYFQAAGTAGLETLKGVLLRLLGSCHVSAGAAVRIVHRVISTDRSKVRAKVVAEVVSDERVVSLFAVAEATKMRIAMHVVLWNCAAHHYRSKEYKTSAELLEKSMLYIPQDAEYRVNRAECFRVLCLCYLGLSQLDRAWEYIDEAEKLEPNVECALLKFKIHMQNNNHGGAISQIQAVTASLDYAEGFLLLSAQEAIASRATPVTVASLSTLLNFYASSKSMVSSNEVVVLRTLITILSKDPGNEPEILKYLTHAHSRVSELGPDCFFGQGEILRRKLRWFAATSWNFGIKSGKDENYELFAELFKLASEFFTLLADDQADENAVMACKSLISTVSSMVDSEHQKKTPLADTEVKEAAQLLDRAGKILKTLADTNQIGEDGDWKIGLVFHFAYTFKSLEISRRISDSKSLQLEVKNFASSKVCNPLYFLKLGIAASQGPQADPEMAISALKQSLSQFLSSLSPDYHRYVAYIVRKLVTLTSVHNRNDDAVYSIYEQAYNTIMVGLKGGEYPSDEGKWLATTAWNRAVGLVRLGLVEEAKKWMKVGLDIAQMVPGMETDQVHMEESAANLTQGSSRDSAESG